MHTTRDIYPVSDFNRKSAEPIKRLQKTGRPEHDSQLAHRLERMAEASTQFENNEGVEVAAAFKKIRDKIKPIKAPQ